VIAAPELSGELSIQENRHIRLNSAGTDVIVWDESADSRLNETRFSRREENVSRRRDAGRYVCRSFLPGHGASKSLRWRTEFTVMDGRRRTANTDNSAANQ